LIDGSVDILDDIVFRRLQLVEVIATTKF